MGKILALYGPSAAGKSEIQKKLTSMNLPKLVTATTRPPREKEMQGVHYHFFDRPTFEKNIKLGKFVEWTNYNNEYYGTLKLTIKDVIKSNTIGHIILDIQGIIALKKNSPGVVAVYIGANLASISRRLLERGSSQEEIQWRINKAVNDELAISYQNIADYIIWNNDGTSFNETINKINKIIKKELQLPI